ncbi:MAG: tetraacyldisaccharide 4'-kinase [candidate division Zixibacteria bacterium]|nr:tetraacyldisaccharide 4'-kinase [candidate division Zixibacteria bacterium]
MEKIWLTIIGHKRNPLYWPLLLVLWLLSLCYRCGLYWSNLGRWKTVKVGAPVISVGNITIGGSGKTPLVIEIARYFGMKNKKVGIVSLGYGRRSNSKIIGLGAELSQKDSAEIGDEVKMMAECLPDAYFAISASKSLSALAVERKYQPDIILVDDGYQHRCLHRDYNILLIDSSCDLRRQSLFPLGRLREPLGAIKRTDRIIVTNSSSSSRADDFIIWLKERYADKKVIEVEFYNDEIIMKPERISIKDFAGRRIYFFAGVGNFISLRNNLEKYFSKIVAWRQFEDHCSYCPHHISQIKNDIRQHQPEYIVTTHKDYVKIRDLDFGRPICYLDLKLRFDSGEKSFYEDLEIIVNR